MIYYVSINVWLQHSTAFTNPSEQTPPDTAGWDRVTIPTDTCLSGAKITLFSLCFSPPPFIKWKRGSVMRCNVMPPPATWSLHQSTAINFFWYNCINAASNGWAYVTHWLLSPLWVCVLVAFPSPDYRNENMCLELMLIAAAANTWISMATIMVARQPCSFRDTERSPKAY